MKTSNFRLLIAAFLLVAIVLVNMGCPHSISKSPRTTSDSTAGNPPKITDSTAGNPPKN